MPRALYASWLVEGVLIVHVLWGPVAPTVERSDGVVVHLDGMAG